MGQEFQAEIPPCLVGLIGSVEDKSPREKLLWKSWDELQESTSLQDKGNCQTKATLLHLKR